MDLKKDEANDRSTTNVGYVKQALMVWKMDIVNGVSGVTENIKSPLRSQVLAPKSNLTKRPKTGFLKIEGKLIDDVLSGTKDSKHRKDRPEIFSSEHVDAVVPKN
ncbi:hypothetical protein TNCV_3701701 [Trichonephila clavipes]|nr:hypothetical protein TNCV_3701701 [Trichonephila clavipes]